MSGKDEEKGKGFKVKDKRRFTAEGEERPDGADAPAPEEKPTADVKREFDDAKKDQTPPAPVDFASFVASLATSALYHMGQGFEDKDKPSPVNLPIARHTIDIVCMLEEKTRGNLTEEEASLLKRILYQLRMQYVELHKQSGQ